MSTRNGKLSGFDSNNLVSDRPVLDGGTNTQGGPRGVTQYYAETLSSPTCLLPGSAHLAPLPASFYRRAIELLKALNVAQALRDVLLALGVLFLLLVVLGAIPLALGMMLVVGF